MMYSNSSSSTCTRGDGEGTDEEEAENGMGDMKVMIMRVGSAGILLLAFRNQRYGRVGGVTYHPADESSSSSSVSPLLCLLAFREITRYRHSHTYLNNKI